MATEKGRAAGRRVAWVTGASGSLGPAIALSFARGGYDLVLQARRDRSALQGLTREAEALGARVAWLFTDLSSPSAAPSLAARAQKVFGRLDALVNSASEFSPTPRGGRLATWDRLFHLNAVTPYLLARETAAKMGSQGGCVINLVDSYVDLPVLRDHAAYLASKSALATLTRVLAMELAPRVRVNAVSPGPITLPSGFGASRRKRIAQQCLLRKAGCPQDVGEAVWFLSQASSITGQVLRVDGGRFV